MRKKQSKNVHICSGLFSIQSFCGRTPQAAWRKWGRKSDNSKCLQFLPTCAKPPRPFFRFSERDFGTKLITTSPMGDRTAEPKLKPPTKSLDDNRPTNH